MREIKLTKGYVAKVDDADYDELSKHKWMARPIKRQNKRGDAWEYVGVVTNLWMVAEDGYRWTRQTSMGNFLLDNNAMDSGLICDHVDGDPLNNRRSNLRLATRSQNSINSLHKRTCRGKKCHSEFRGVTKRSVPSRNGEKVYKYWAAGITKDGKYHHLGYFETDLEAACHYDMAAQHYHGDFARLNFDGAAYDKWYNETYVA